MCANEKEILANQKTELQQAKLIVRWLFGLTASIIGGFMVVFSWMWQHSESYGKVVTIVSEHSRTLDEIGHAPSRYEPKGAILDVRVTMLEETARETKRTLDSMKSLLQRFDRWMSAQEMRQKTLDSMQ